MDTGLRRFTRRTAVTGAKVGGAAVVTASTALGGLALTSGPAGAVGPPAGRPPVTSFTESCSLLSGLITFPATVNFFGRAPGAAAPGTPVVLSAVRSTVTIPASFVNLALAFGISSLNFTISESDINATNTVQGTENTLPAPVTETIALTANQPASFQLPSTPATVGPWTAGSSGTISFTPGNTVESALGLPITCTPTSEPVLGTTVIRP